MAIKQTYEKKEFQYGTYNEYKSHRNEMESNGYRTTAVGTEAVGKSLISVEASYEKDYPILL